MNHDESDKKKSELGNGNSPANPPMEKDRGTYIAKPLSQGGFTDEHGAIVSEFSSALSEGPDGVYKTQLGLDKHVLSEKHRADQAREEANSSHQFGLSSKHRADRSVKNKDTTDKDQRSKLVEKNASELQDSLTPRVTEPSPTKRRSPNPTIVAGISLFILTIVATLLVTLLLNNIQNSSGKKTENQSFLDAITNLSP